MNNEENGVVAQLTGHAEQVVALGGAMQQVRSTHTTAVAVQRPRSLARSTRQLEEEAALSGERFYYGWGAGKDKIEGPSVKLANAAARCWGNCAVEMLPIQDLPDAWVMTSVFVDLETGFTITRQFRQSKTSIIYGKHDDARKMDMRFQNGQSRATRNVILNALPAGMIDAAMDAAKSGVRKKIEGFIARVDKDKGPGKGMVEAVDMVINGLAKQGVKEAAVFAKLEISSRTAINIDRLIILRGDLTALEDGETRAEELYPSTAAADRVDSIKTGNGKPPATPTDQTPLDFHREAMKDAATLDALDKAYKAACEDKRVAKGDRSKIVECKDDCTITLQADEPH